MMDDHKILTRLAFAVAVMVGYSLLMDSLLQRLRAGLWQDRCEDLKTENAALRTIMARNAAPTEAKED